MRQRELPNSFSLFPEDCSWISDATNKTAAKQCHSFRRCVVWISDASKRDAKFYIAFAALFLDFRYSQERTALSWFHCLMHLRHHRVNTSSLRHVPHCRTRVPDYVRVGLAV